MSQQLEPVPSTSSSEPVPSTSASSAPVAVDDSAVSREQCYPVADVLLRYTNGVVNGPDLVAKLSAGTKISRAERMWLVKTLGKYLMRASFTVDKPSKKEKTIMAQSIVSRFPVLKSDGSVGYEHFYDPNSRTGFLESYIRQRGSRCADIATPKAARRHRQMRMMLTLLTRL